MAAMGLTLSEQAFYRLLCDLTSWLSAYAFWNRIMVRCSRAWPTATLGGISPAPSMPR
jgi:hypothetical protein